MRDHRAGAGERPLANVDRRHQQAAAADEGPVADVRLMFVLPVEIAGDGARADIDPFADGGVTQVADVMHLAACAHAGVFQLGSNYR